MLWPSPVEYHIWLFRKIVSVLEDANISQPQIHFRFPWICSALIHEKQLSGHLLFQLINEYHFFFLLQAKQVKDFKLHGNFRSGLETTSAYYLCSHTIPLKCSSSLCGSACGKSLWYARQSQPCPDQCFANSQRDGETKWPLQGQTRS